MTMRSFVRGCVVGLGMLTAVPTVAQQSEVIDGPLAGLRLKEYVCTDANPENPKAQAPDRRPLRSSIGCIHQGYWAIPWRTGIFPQR
jgi:hypothetical protein